MGYDPNQSVEERRRIQRGMREIEAGLLEDQEAYKKANSTKIADTLNSLEEYNEQIKGTGEALLDAKNLTSIIDMNLRKVTFLTAGNLGNGVDGDDLVSRCKHYMRRTAGIADEEDEVLTHTQRGRRGRPSMRRGAASDDDGSDDEDGNGGDMMNWAHLGQYACIPNLRRPALSGFLLGPLSVQKKLRKVVIRTAPLRVRDLQEVRPEVLTADDIEKNEKNDLTAICNKILKQLDRVQKSAVNRVEIIFEDDDKDDEDVAAAMEQLGLTAGGCIDLVRFCINPWSFGQTIENMFYVSFLIKEGKVKVDYEENGLPSLCELSLSMNRPQPLSNTQYQVWPIQRVKIHQGLRRHTTARRSGRQSYRLTCRPGRI